MYVGIFEVTCWQYAQMTRENRTLATRRRTANTILGVKAGEGICQGYQPPNTHYHPHSTTHFLPPTLQYMQQCKQLSLL